MQATLCDRVRVPLCANERGDGIILVTHDHGELDVFNGIYEMEDEVMQHQSSDAVKVGCD